jgi:hypothetical protein
MRTFIPFFLVPWFLGLATSGCKRNEDPAPAATAETPAPGPPGRKPNAPAKPGGHASPPGGPVLGEKVEIPQANVVFNAPGGWKRNMTSNGWALYKAPDNHARLGYVAFSQPGEATSRIGQLAEAFDLTGLTWGSPSDGFVGRDRFPDHEGETRTCTMKNGDPCDMKYMTINPGGTVQIMVVYLVNTLHGEPLRSHATASVASLRRM